MGWTWPVGGLLAFLVALVTTPAGVSGAVLLLPIQLSVLKVPSPALPGVVAGAVIRVEWLSDSHSFTYVAAAVLMPLGLWLALGSQRVPREQPREAGRPLIWALALVIGVVGGIYGIGGGSLLAPIMIAFGFSVYEVAPATIAATFITSVAGIATYQVLQLSHGGAIAPEWGLGLCLGVGGFAGSYCGARLQSRIPERSLRRLLGAIACLVAARYFHTAAEQPAVRQRPHVAVSSA